MDGYVTLLGSVGLAVAARADCPVVVVRGDKNALTDSYGRVLLGAGDPDASTEAVRFAFRAAEARGCELHVVRAWRRPVYEGAEHAVCGEDPGDRPEAAASELLDGLAAEAAQEHPDMPLRTATAEGPARKVLVDRTAAADLVVLGARRRTGHFGLQLAPRGTHPAAPRGLPGGRRAAEGVTYSGPGPGQWSVGR